MVAGRDADRLRGEPASRTRTSRSVARSGRGRRDRRGHADRQRRRRGLRPPDLDARRRRDPRPGRPVAAGRLPDRHLAVRGRRLGAAPVAGRTCWPARPQAGRRDEQRHDARRGPAARAHGRRQGGPVHGARRRLIRAVAGGAGRATASRNGSPRTSTTSPAGTPSPVRGERIASLRSARAAPTSRRWSPSTSRRRHPGGPDDHRAQRTILAARSSSSSRSSGAGRPTAARSRAGCCPAGTGRQPLALEIHGGPHTLYGWSPMLEWQILAGGGVGVFARTRAARRDMARRSTGRTWATGATVRWPTSSPASTRPIEDGLADPDRLGVTAARTAAT